MPTALPTFSGYALQALSRKSFYECMAELLNQFYDCGLSAWDLSFAAGRQPVRTVRFGQRMTIAECWRNPQWQFSGLVENVMGCIRPGYTPGFWDRTVVRIAALFGIVTRELPQYDLLDVAVHSGDLSGVLSAWYARKMGLPIGNIICCCSENSAMWELLWQGQVHTDGLARKTLAEPNACWLPEGLEQLIYECGGRGAVADYLLCCQQGQPYTPEDGVHRLLSAGMRASVAGDQRILQTIFGVWNSYSYLLSASAALIYTGVLDYRFNEKETRACLLLSEKSWECDKQTVARALHRTEAELRGIKKQY